MCAVAAPKIGKKNGDFSRPDARKADNAEIQHLMRIDKIENI